MTNTLLAMTKVIYSVAMSLDGYIARRDGSYDWIPMDPSIDWGTFMSRFDTVLMGRRTYEVVEREGLGIISGLNVYVFSQSVLHDRVREAHLVTGSPGEAVKQLKSESKKDIWLMGGGDLFRTLLDARLVDIVEVTVVPVLLGDGIPLVKAGPESTRLNLVDTRPFQSGMISLTYEIVRR